MNLCCEYRIAVSAEYKYRDFLRRKYPEKFPIFVFAIFSFGLQRCYVQGYGVHFYAHEDLHLV